MIERRTIPSQGSVVGTADEAKPEEALSSGENAAAERAPLEESVRQPEPGGDADRFKGEYEYVPLECPRCGLAGKVKISRLDRTFTCKQCKRVFHVTVHGVVNGERPPPDVLPDPEAPFQSQRVNRLERWFAGLPLWLRWSIAGALLGALAVAVILVGKLQQDPFPTDLGERAVIAGQAFAKGDWRTLDRLAMSDTSDALRQWYDKTPRDEFSGLGMESEVKATVGKMFEMFRRAEKDEQGGKKLVADFRTPVEIHLPERAQDSAKFTVDFVWVKSKRGQWQIDGQWMLDFVDGNTSSAKAATAARSKAQPRSRRRERN